MKKILGTKDLAAKYHNGTVRVTAIYHGLRLVWNIVSSWWRDSAIWSDNSRWRE